MNLHRLLNPRSIAVIGGHHAALAIEQCDVLGFEGEIWPVNPSRESIGGRRAVASVAELPEAPDAALVAVNRSESVDVVEQLAEVGAGGAVCYASGFAERGEEGAELQRRLVDHDMPVIGPNCYGTINAISGAALWPDIQGCQRVSERGAALITQSGNIALNLTMNQRGLEFSHVISIGNQASVRIEDCLLHLVQQPEVGAVGIHAESILDPTAFATAMREAHRTRTPVVMLKSGRSATAASIATSHTAAISRPEHAYDALFTRYGVITVDTVSQLAATLAILLDIGPLPGNRMVSLSCSGGEASIVADRASVHGIRFEPFTAETQTRIAATLSNEVAITNPLDYHTFIWGDERRLTDCFAATLAADTDAAMLILDWPTTGDTTSWEPTLQSIRAAHAATGTPTVVAATLAENLPGEIRDRLRDVGIGVAFSIDEALAACAGAAAAGRWLATSGCEPHTAVEEPLGRATPMLEVATKRWLAAGGVAVPQSILGDAGRPDLGQLRFPLVAKAVGLAHKSEIDGVVTGILDHASLRTAIDRLSQLTGSVLVEEEVTDVVAELLVSVRREPPFGLLLAVASGGTHAELAPDLQSALVPVPHSHVVEMLEALRVAPLLEGFRGRAAADIGAVVETIDRLCGLVMSHPEMRELEINPLLITPTGAVAVDALATVTEGALDTLATHG